MTTNKNRPRSAWSPLQPARSPLWLLIALFAITAMAFAACGNDDDDADPTQPAQEPTPTSAPSGDDSSDDAGDDTPPAGGGDLDDIPRTTSNSVSMTGAGATFPNVLYSRWVDEYNQLNGGIQVNYQSIGSGGGIRAVIDKTVDFGGTDGPMTDEQKADAGAKVWHIPAAMGAVVPAYNLSAAPDDLRFSQDTIAGIFLGNITRWDDEAIAADNPGVSLPDQSIGVCHRSDGSGTTFIWVDFLAAISEEWRDNIGVATSVNWPRGNFVGGNGNEGVAQCIRAADGSIGYVELAYATQNNIPVAQLENRDGNFVDPTLEAVSAAAAGLIDAGEFPEDMEARVVNAPGANSWPAAGFTWMLIYEDLNTLDNMNLQRAQELIRYTLWALDEDGGQQYTFDLDYAPIHPDVVALAHAAIKTITYDGQPVWETMLP